MTAAFRTLDGSTCGTRLAAAKGSVVLCRCLVLFMLLLVQTGCGALSGIFGGGLRVETVDHGAAPPGNVAVYLAVRDGDEPVTDLAEQDFHLFENGVSLDRSSVGLTLADRSSVALHRAVLLVDTSGAKDELTRKQLSRGAASFVTAVRKHQAVSVYAFDGAATLVHVGDYARGEASAPEELPKLSSHAPRDSSRNLNGAVLEGLKQLDARLMTERKPVRIGTLVVLTSGPDIAARSTREAVEAALDGSTHHLVAVVVAPEDQPVDVGALSRDGLFRAPSLAMAGIGLDEAARHVSALEQKYYLVQYCSPARAGTRRLTIEVRRTTLEGKEQKASADLDFDATGFASGCDAKRTPRFVGKAAAPASKPGAGTPAKGNSTTPTPPPDDDEVAPPPDAPGYAPLPGK